MDQIGLFLHDGNILSLAFARLYGDAYTSHLSNIVACFMEYGNAPYSVFPSLFSERREKICSIFQKRTKVTFWFYEIKTEKT
jgi:hypothetical protein